MSIFSFTFVKNFNFNPMKKVLFLSFLFISLMIKAQTPIVLNASDLGVPVKSYDLRIDTTSIAAIIPGTAGTNKTWSFLLLHSTQDTLKINLINAANGVMHTYFPSANIAYREDTLLNYNYYKSSATSLVHYGIVTDYLGTHDSIKVVFSKPDTIVKIPSAYNDSCISLILGDSKSRCHYTFDTNINGVIYPVPIDTVRIKHEQMHYYKFDAWGTITTPTDVAVPVLRQRNIVTTRDTVWGYANAPPPFTSYSGWYLLTTISDHSQEYVWWMKNLGIPYIKMPMNGMSDTSVAKVQWVRNSTFGISTNTVSNTLVYPNPANYAIKFNNAKTFSELVIYDVLGKEIERVQTGNSDEITVPVSNLANGLYFYNILGKTEKVSGKFIVKH
jgi:hypothetical protein